jgi:hypothetical protein
MDCIYCNSQLPEKGFFCPNCFKQTKCKHCNENLIKDAKICVFCGEEIGQKGNASNFNSIEFSETEKGRKFKASFTDTVGQSISDSFGMILANKIGTKRNLPTALPPSNNNHQEVETEDTEAEISNPSTISTTPELEQLKKIFKEDGENISLLETRLKAKSKRDYGIRLALVFLYYKHLSGIDNVPRSNLTAILEDASVEDANFRYWLGNNPLIGVNNNQVHIKAPGKDAAREYITEIFNPEIKDKWQIGTTSKVGRKSKDKKEKSK